MLPFHFFLSADHTPVVPESPLWQMPLPSSRAAAAGPPATSASCDPAQVTCGAYFGAVQRALGADGCAPLYQALTEMAGAPFEDMCIDSVDVQLLKHGQFYHPSRIVVRAARDSSSLAFNLAFSSDGMELMPREISALKSLSEQEGDLAIPRVLAQGECILETAPGAERQGAWFLSPWCDGFHEFHLTHHTEEHLAVMVWDDATAPSLLKTDQVACLLEGAARILTTAVNPHSLAHIFPWHHAAGDFVVHLDVSGHPCPRLITVRDYQPLISPADDADAVLDHLLYAQILLVVQAALRLRVDRLDGVGEIALYPLSMVAPICRGLLEGLARMRRRWHLPPELDSFLMDYLRALSPGQLLELNQTIQGGFAPGSPERAVISTDLETHVQALYDSLQKCL
ncbi:MAG: hypothetical protein P8010_12470 [Desulfosarcinaceae bacterium]|jgi:hypothetical protein